MTRTIHRDIFSLYHSNKTNHLSKCVPPPTISELYIEIKNSQGRNVFQVPKNSKNSIHKIQQIFSLNLTDVLYALYAPFKRKRYHIEFVHPRWDLAKFCSSCHLTIATLFYFLNVYYNYTFNTPIYKILQLKHLYGQAKICNSRTDESRNHAFGDLVISSLMKLTDSVELPGYGH